MTAEPPFQPRPAEYKTEMDGLGGLVRVRLEGGLHQGRELFIDEPDVPAAIYVTPRAEPFEWWPADLQSVMAGTALGGDPGSPPLRYLLTVDPTTREPRYVATPEEAPGVD